MNAEKMTQTLFTEKFVLWLVERINICEDDIAKFLQKTYQPWTINDLISEYKRTTNNTDAKLGQD